MNTISSPDYSIIIYKDKANGFRIFSDIGDLDCKWYRNKETGIDWIKRTIDFWQRAAEKSIDPSEVEGLQRKIYIANEIINVLSD